jgi:uncharacterized protein
METTTLGNTGLEVPRLGLGNMRLPMTTIGDKEYLDYEAAIAVIQRALDAGIRYLDTAFLYCAEESEIAVGRALNTWDGPQDEVVLTTKCTKFRMKEPGNLRRMLEHQLYKLDRDSVTFYLFHGIGWDNWHEIDERTDWVKDMLAVKEEGLAEHIGFSFHDEPQALMRLVDEGIFELVTCQYNYLDRSNQEAIQYAHDHGLAVVVMGPVGGGRLAVVPSQLRDELAIDETGAAGLALRFVLAHPGVSVALSGMGTIDMVDQNVAAVSQGPLSDAEVETVNRMMDQARELARLYCTGCQYCMPCPSGVNIARCFELYNYYTVYGLKEYAVDQYRHLIEQDADASVCTQCQECLEKCPQHIDIPDQLEEVDALLGALARAE